MVNALKFSKMHGLGNDYVVFDLFNGTNKKIFDKVSESGLKSFAKRVCDRHFGIAADKDFGRPWPRVVS